MFRRAQGIGPVTVRRAVALGVLLPVTAVVVLVRGCAEERPAPVHPASGPATVVRSASSSTTAATEAEGPSRATDLARRWPIVARLPYEAPAWRVDYRVDGGRLILKVRLRALRLRDPGTESYESQLSRHKAEALAWLGPGAWTIEWDPPEAAAL